MVLDTFRGHNPNAPFIIFQDGDRRNHRLENLRAASREEYSQHLAEKLPARYAAGEVFSSIGTLRLTRGDFDLGAYWISNVTEKVYTELSNKLLTYNTQVPYASFSLRPGNTTGSTYFAVHQLVHNTHVDPNQSTFQIDHEYGNTENVSSVNVRKVSRLAMVKLACSLDFARCNQGSASQLKLRYW